MMGTLVGVADAGPFQAKSSQGDWARRQVDRTFVLPKGWLEVGIAGEHKNSEHYRGADGGLREQPEGMLWQHSKLWLELSQGFSPRTTLYARVPYVRSSLRPSTGSSITSMAMGDATAGVRLQPVASGRFDVAGSLELKVPSGVEWPEGSGGPGNTGSFLTGTGITNLGAHMHAAVRAVGVVKGTTSVGYVRKFPGVVGYVVQTDGFGNGVINPGDEWVSDSSIAVNATDYAAVEFGAQVRRIAVSKIGVNADGDRIMESVRHSDGTWLNGRITLAVEPSEHVTVQTGVALDRVGGDSRPFAHLGLEEFSPQPGLQWLGRAVVRW